MMSKDNHNFSSEGSHQSACNCCIPPVFHQKKGDNPPAPGCALVDISDDEAYEISVMPDASAPAKAPVQSAGAKRIWKGGDGEIYVQVAPADKAKVIHDSGEHMNTWGKYYLASTVNISFLGSQTIPEPGSPSYLIVRDIR